MDTVWSLVIVILVVAAAGFIAWATDHHHDAYGIMLPVGAAVASACLTWIILVFAGTGYIAGLTWMPWVLPMAIGIAAAVCVPLLLGRRRTKRDVVALTEILRRS
jgi:FtsH-binding integral membrane protein